MKKLTAMALALTMMVGLAACGDNGSSSDDSSSKKETTTAAAITEATTEPATEATTVDPYAGMTQLKFDQDYNGINASVYVPYGFELSSSRYDSLAMNYYKCTEESMKIKMTVKMNIEFIPESRKKLDESGYELYTGNDNGYDAIFQYNESANLANYVFFKEGGPDGSIIKFTVSLGSLFDVQGDDLDKLFDVVGKSATIEGEYSDTASAGNENGELTTNDGLLTFPAEIEIKGQKVQFEKKLINGMMKMVAETPEIDGVKYRITIHNKTDEASYKNLLEKDSDPGKETTVAGYSAAGQLYIREGRLESNYCVKFDDNNYESLSVDGLKTDYDTYKAQLESDYDSLLAVYDGIVTDLIKAATVNIDGAAAETTEG